MARQKSRTDSDDVDVDVDDLAAEELARRLSALPEPDMRTSVLAEALVAGDPRRHCRILTAIVQRGRQGGPPFDVALLALGGLLADPDRLTYERRSVLYAAARSAELLDLADLFLSAGAASDVPPPPALTRDGRPVTLGERKSLARGRRREILDRLMRDPDPAVIRILLGNPRLCERDVVAIAARRPQIPEVQREIARSRRWIARYDVKLALIFNPYTPTDIAIRLLGFLSATNLRQAATEPVLADIVRRAARRRIQRRD
jgi:hypothetical protein